MLQRIQTIWLLLATVAILSLFLFPYIQMSTSEGIGQAIKVTGVYQNINGELVQKQEFILLTIVTVIIALVPLVIIFYFRNRKKQVMLCYIAIVLILAYSFWLVQTAKKITGDIQLGLQNYGIGVIFPSLAILFIILALKGIRHDNKLIKSSERLR